MKKTKKLLIAILVLLLIAALAVTGILLWPKGTGGGSTDSGSGFVIESYPIIPTAYLNKEYDLRDAIEIEEGVTYSASALYVDYNNGMTEHEVPVNDLKLTPVDLFELVVTITAQKGEQTAKKVLYIPVSIIADPIDQTLSSKGSAAWADDGIVKTVTINPDYIKAENSFTALEIAFNGSSSHYYGTALGILKDDDLMKLYSDQTWENAVLQFWVFNPMEQPIEFQIRIQDNQTGLNTDWSDAEDFEYRQIAQPGEWTLCLFSLRAQGTIHRLGNKETLVLKSQYHGMPGLNVNYAYNFIIDGLDIVDASAYPDLDTTFTKSTETLDQGWENLPLDTGWQGTETVYDHEIVMGEGSTCSLKAVFSGPKGLKEPFVSFAPQWAVAYGKLRELPDMSGGTLTAYFKFENMPAHAELNLTNREWETTNTLPFTMKKLDNGWYEGTIDLYDLEFAAAARSDNIIRFNICFPNASKNSVVYIDTMKFTYKEVNKVKEAATKDWINLPVDSGMNNLSTYKYSTSMLKAPGSVRSVYAKAKSNANGAIVFSQEWGVRYKSLSSLPDMRSGVLHAYFYFGSQTPKATAQIFNKEWGNSTDVSFVFESVGNGWYYGSIPCSLFKGYERGNSKDIIRIEIGFPAGYSVYIDGLMHNPNETYSQKVDLEDLLGSGLVSVGNLTANGGSKVVTDVTNGSTDAMYIYATGDTNYPLLTSRFVLPVDASGWDNLSFDMLADNASTWVGMRVYYLDASGNEKTASAGTDITAGAWNTVTVDLSAFKDVNWKKVTGFGLQFNMDKEDGGLKTGTNKIYIDNWKLTEDPELPADPDDLLADATLTGGSFHSNPALYQAENDVTVKNGATSTRSWKFSVKEKAWPTAQFTFANVQDLTDKTVQFDVKFAPLANVADPFERIDVMLLGANGASLHAYINNVDVDNGAVTANADGWYTITLDLTSLEFDRTAVHGIQFRFNFDQFEAIYVDNMKLAEQAGTEPEPELPADPDDLLGDATLTGGGFQSNPSLYIAENDLTVKNGTTSTRSWKFSVTEKAWPTAQFTFANVQDLTGKTVQLDIKFVSLGGSNPLERIDVILLGANGTTLHGYILNKDVEDGKVAANADGWYTITLDLTGLDFDRTAVHGIQFRFNFDEFEAIYLDNMKLVVPAEPEPEPPEFDPEDLIASSVIDPVTGLNVEIVTDKTNGSDEALYIHSETPAGYPTVKLMFAEAQDISVFNTLSLDGVVETASRWIGLRLYYLDGNGEQQTATSSIDLTGTEWSSHVIALNSFTNADLTKVVGFGLCLNFHATEGFVTGENNQMWIDNMKLLNVEEEPELPTFNAEDLIASSIIEDVTGLTVETVTDKTNGSDEALYIHSETPAGYPTVKLMFAEAQDLSAFDNLSLDGVIETASRWIGLRLYYLDGNGEQQTATSSIDLTGTEWSSHVIALNSFTNADLTKVVGFGLCLNFHATEGFVAGENNQMWIDNMKLTVNPPEDLNDLLSDATMSSGHFVDRPDLYKYDTNSNVVNGEGSVRSWKLYTETGWPQAFITFAEKQDLTNKALQFDVKFVEKEGKTNRWIGIYLLDSEGNKLFNSQPIDDCKDGSLSANADGWYTVTLNFGTLDFDRTDVATVYLCFDFESMDEVYLDNMKLVDWTPEPEFDPADVMPTSQITGITATGTLTVATVTDDTYQSEDAVKVSATEKAGWPTLKILFQEAQDLSDYNELVFAAKSVDASRWLGLRIYYLDANSETKTASLGFDLSVKDEWENCVIPMSDFPTFDSTKVVGVGFCFNFDDGFVADKTNSILIDAVGFRYTKPAATEETEKASDLLANAKFEWSNMIQGIDSYETSTEVNGDQSLRSWKFSTSGESGGNGWPVFQLKLDKSYDMSNKDLVLDIKFENCSQWFSLYALENSSWAKVAGSYGKDVTGTGWQTVTFDLSSAIVEGKTLEDVYLISFCFNFESKAGQQQAVYIDNVRLVDAQ